MKKNTYSIYFAFICFIVIGLMSCSSTQKSSAYPQLDYNDKYNRTESSEINLKTIPDDVITKKTNQRTRKMIYQAQLTFEVDSISSSKTQTEQIMKAHQGYLLQSSNYSMQIRVPANDLKNVLADLKKMGKVTYENIQGQDITDSYYDIKLRLDNAEKTRNRYLELLGQAKNVSEILKVEKELERLNEKIESYKGSMKSYNQQIEYSLVTISFQVKTDKARPGPLGYVFVGLYKAVKWLFVWN
ncbi:MAG: DUF4349 domain-containing protein [Saprospiraceae bacterium]